MYKQILIATDGSKLANNGLEQGLRLASALHAEVTILTVTQPPQQVDVGQFWEGSAALLREYRAATNAKAEEVLAAACHRAAELEVHCHPIHMADRNPAEAILDVASERQADVIVITSHGHRGLGRALIGSQVTRVIMHSKVPVLVVH